MKRALLLKLLLPLLMLLPAAGFAGPVYACGKSAAAQQVYSGVGQTGASGCDDSGVQTTLSTVVGFLSLIVGAVSVIAIIMSGFKYITSGGDSGKVSNAKGSLMYAMIGLAIAALAQLLVHFVLYQANNATLPACPADHSIKPPACRS